MIYSLTGKIICGKCGAHFFGIRSASVHRGKKYDYKYYCCSESKTYRTCSCKRVRKDFLEDIVLEEIKKNILNEKSIYQIANEIISKLNENPDGQKNKLKDLKKELLDVANLNVLKPHSKVNFGKNSIFPISVTHSIPDCVCYVLYTEDGAIVYTGDFVFDSTMMDNYKTDIGKLAYVGKQGVLCLLSESIYAEHAGHTSPNNRVYDFIKDVVKNVTEKEKK